MADLPDWYTLVTEVEAEAYSIRGGADTSKPASPEAKDVYFATDTEKLWFCVADGAWGGYWIPGSIFNDHSARHEDGGDDEISLAGLDGEPSTLTTHKDLTTGVHGVGAGAIVGTTLSQTLTNKTLTTPVIASIYQDASKTNLLTLPAATDTLVGKATTDILTNKTLTSPTIQGTVSAGTGLTMPAFTQDGHLIMAYGAYIQMTTEGGALRTFAWVDAQGNQNIRGYALYLNYNYASDISMWGSGAGTARVLQLTGSNAASGVGNVSDAPTLRQRATYRNGNDTLTTWDFDIFHDMTAGGATPASHVDFRIHGVDILTLINTNGTVSLAIAGDLGCNSHKLTEVDTPTASTDGATKGYADGLARERLNWLAASVESLADTNRTTTLTWTDLDVTANTSASTFAVILQLVIHVDAIGTGDYFQIEVRKNGDTPTDNPRLRVDEWAVAGDFHYEQVIVGVDAGEVLEYQLTVLDISGMAQADFYIRLLGYYDLY